MQPLGYVGKAVTVCCTPSHRMTHTALLLILSVSTAGWTSEVLGLDIYGGDCLLASDGTLYPIVRLC